MPGGRRRSRRRFGECRRGESERIGFVVAVGEVAAQVEGVLVAGDGALVGAEAARPGIAEGKAVQGVGLPDRVIDASRGVQASVLCQGLVVPVPAPEEEGGKGPRELPGVGIEPGFGGQLDGGEEPGVFRNEPVQCVLGRGGLCKVIPGMGEIMAIDSRYGSSSRAAAWAVCR